MKKLFTNFLPIALLLACFSVAQAQFSPAPTEGARVSLTTAQVVGKTITLNVKAKTDNIWIDLDGDGIYQRGEQVALNQNKTYTLKAQKITIYGDLTQLICNNGQLTTLKIALLPNLTALACNFNQLTELDLSNAPKIEQLYCTDNQLKSLVLDRSANLTQLDCRNNLLKSIDLAKAPKLSNLFCQQNQLDAVTLSHNLELERINCADNKLSTLSLTGLKKLSYLDCSKNQIEELDFTPATGLSWLVCYRNRIKATAMEKLVKSLPEPSEGELYPFDPNSESGEQNVFSATHMTIAKKKNWTVMDPDGEELPVGEIFDPAPTDGAQISFVTAQAKGKELRLFVEASNENIWIDLNANGTYEEGEKLVPAQLGTVTIQAQSLTLYGELTNLDISHNQVTSLDLSKAKQLKRLECSHNQIKQLDLSGTPLLEELYCVQNELSEIGFISLPNLTQVLCWENHLKEGAMQALIKSLPTPAGEGTFRPVNTSPETKEQNICTKEQVKLAKSKNWDVKDALGNDFPGTDSVEDILETNGNIVLYAKEGTLYLSNLEAGMPIMVFTLEGYLFHRTIAKDPETNIALPHGSYLLRIGRYSIKANML